MSAGMKIYGTPTSPYVRKARVAALELGAPFEFVALDLAEWDKFGSVNPIHRIPVLETADGEKVFDSQVICEYLDAEFGKKRHIFPPDAPRWQLLKTAAYGAGIMDWAVPRRHETLRPVDQQSEKRLADYKRNIGQILNVLEENPPSDDFDIGGICVACAIGYLDFRFPDDEWRADRPKLAAWYASASERSSMRETPYS